MILTLAGAGICFYLALDLYLTLASYARTPPRDYVFVAALAAIGSVFVLVSVAFWYFPWSKALLKLNSDGITLQVRGLGAMPETLLTWADLSAVTVLILPRGASLLTLRTQTKGSKSVRTWAIEADIDEVLASLHRLAKANSYIMAGPTTKAPLLWFRSWSVAPFAENQG